MGPVGCFGQIENIKRQSLFYFHYGKAIRYALCKIDSSDMLSSREKEVLKLISKGHSSKEIADILGISIYTVSRHRQNIIESMNVRNSLQACRMAHQMGLI